MFNQVELFFVDPSVISLKRNLFMGHFTSDLDIKDGCRFEIGISLTQEPSVQVNKIVALTNPSFETNNNDVNHYIKPELNFLNATSLSFMMREKQLKCFTLMEPDLIRAEIAVIKIPSLNEGEYSYLFFGFSDNKLISQIHSQVFYTDRNGVVHCGDEVKHKMGDHLANDFCVNFAFGFGRKLTLLSTSSKEYLDGIEKYRKIKISDEPISEEMQKDLHTVFSNYDQDYFDYLKVMSRKMKEKGMEGSKFWMSEEDADLFHKITRSAMQEVMSDQF